MRSDLGGSVTPTQGAQAFPGGSARRWGVLGRESDEHGWNEVRQERGQWPGQVCLGGFGMRDGQRDRGRRVCSGAEASGMWSQGRLSGSWGQGHAGASQNTDVPCSRTEMRRAPNRTFLLSGKLFNAAHEQTPFSYGRCLSYTRTHKLGNHTIFSSAHSFPREDIIRWK